MSSFSGVTFILFRFRRYTFIEAAALRSIVLRHASTSYVFPFRVVFFYLVTTGWIFLHQVIMP